jgi:hypothetical protein
MERSLSHGVELMTEEDDKGRLVRLEEGLDGDPEIASSLVGLEGEVEDIVRDKVEELVMDAGVGNGMAMVRLGEGTKAWTPILCREVLGQSQW